MIWKSCAVLLLASFCCCLGAGEISKKKIQIITQIVSGEFRKLVVETPQKKAKPWQYKYETDPQKKKALYLKVGAAALKKIQAKVKPFDVKGPVDPIPKAELAEINKTVAKRFPYKNAAEISMGAVKEAKLAYPLVQQGDDVTIRYYRGGIYAKVSGKVQSVREGGTVFEVDDKLVRLSEIVKSDRQYFDPELNNQLREKFIKDFQDPKKLANMKRDYRNNLMSRAHEKVVSNEKKGFIFFRGKWVTAKYVTEQLALHFNQMTEKRIAAERILYVNSGKAAAAPKKK